MRRRAKTRGKSSARLLFALAALSFVLGCSSDPNTARKREYVYVTNRGENMVSVIDGINLSRVTKIAVGLEPSGVAVSPTRDEVYVVNSGSDSVSVIDPQRNAVSATIPVGDQPFAISISADGKRGFAAARGSITRNRGSSD